MKGNITAAQEIVLDAIAYELTNEVEASEEELRLASAYFSSGMVISDSIERVLSGPRSGIPGYANRNPCTGWCCDSGDISWLMKLIGNDVDKTVVAINEHIQKGFESCCTGCTLRYFTIAEALEYHACMLRNLKKNKMASVVIEAASTRGEILRGLGYKTA